MANRIKFDFLRNLRKTEMELLELITSICPELTPIDCFLARSHGLITFSRNQSTTILFTPETLQKFDRHNVKPRPPKAYYVEKSIFVSNVRPYITCLSAKELIANFNNLNEDLTAESIFTITTNNPNRAILKITLVSKEQVERALVQGLWLRGMKFEPENIQKEKENKVNQCYKCFSFEHSTKNCKQPNQICSICTENHNYRDCTAKDDPNKIKCNNCGGKHISIARSCPTRKQKIQHQQQLEQVLQQQQMQQQQTNQPPQINLNNFPPLHPTTKNQPNSNQQIPQQTTSTNNPTAHVNHYPSTNNPTVHVNHYPSPNNSTANVKHYPSTNNNFEEHEWEMKLTITDTFAKMCAKGNPETYLKIMNTFLTSVGLTPLNISNTDTELQQAQTSPSKEDPTITANQSQCNTPLQNTPPSLAITPINSDNSNTLHSTPNNDSTNFTPEPPQNTTIIVKHNKNTHSPPQIHIPSTTHDSEEEITTNSGNMNLQLSPSTPRTNTTESDEYTTETDIEVDVESDQINEIPSNQQANKKKKKNKKRATTEGHTYRLRPNHEK